MCFLGVWWVLWGFFDLFFMKSFLFGADAAALLGTKLNLLLLSPSSSSSSSPLSLPLFMQVHLESNKTMHLGALPLPTACSVVCLHETLLLKWSGQLDHFSFLFSFLFLSPLSLPVPHTRTNRTNLQTLKITEQLLLASKLISCSSCQGSDSQIKTKQWLLTWKLDCNLQPRDVLELLPPRTCSAVHLQQRAMQCWPPLPPWAESLAPPRVAL